MHLRYTFYGPKLLLDARQDHHPQCCMNEQTRLDALP
jgi:hypothetical protein